MSVAAESKWAAGDVLVLRTRGPCQVLDVRSDGDLWLNTGRALEPYERWTSREIDAEIVSTMEGES